MHGSHEQTRSLDEMLHCGRKESNLEWDLEVNRICLEVQSHLHVWNSTSPSQLTTVGEEGEYRVLSLWKEGQPGPYICIQAPMLPYNKGSTDSNMIQY